MAALERGTARRCARSPRRSCRRPARRAAELRVLHQQHADLEPLLLAVRQQAGEALLLAFEVDRLQRLARCGRAAPATAARAALAARRLSVFSASSRFSNTVWCSNTVGFWNLRPMPAARSRLGQAQQVDRLAEERGAGVGPRLAGDDVHHRRLAGAVGADDAAQLAALDGQRQRVERLEAVEADGDVVEVEDRAVRSVDLVRARRCGRSRSRRRPMPAGADRLAHDRASCAPGFQRSAESRRRADRAAAQCIGQSHQPVRQEQRDRR